MGSLVGGGTRKPPQDGLYTVGVNQVWTTHPLLSNEVIVSPLPVAIHRPQPATRVAQYPGHMCRYGRVSSVVSEEVGGLCSHSHVEWYGDVARRCSGICLRLGEKSVIGRIWTGATAICVRPVRVVSPRPSR